MAECFMKPLGKAMKIAHYGGENKQKVLNQLLSSYRATPHSATGITLGEALFRQGYKTVFPERKTLSESGLQKALRRDQQNKQDRSDNLNESKYRQKPTVEVGDKVYTRNNKHTEFQPMFSPTPLTVTSVGKGRIICKAENRTRHRHPPDRYTDTAE